MRRLLLHAEVVGIIDKAECLSLSLSVCVAQSPRREEASAVMATIMIVARMCVWVCARVSRPSALEYGARRVCDEVVMYDACVEYETHPLQQNTFSHSCHPSRRVPSFRVKSTTWPEDRLGSE